MWIQFQSYLFEQIKTRIPANQSLAKAIGALLGVSESTIYKKIRGEVPLSGDEVILLARHFRLSADAFLHEKSEVVVGHYTALSPEVSHPEKYLERLHRQLLQLSALPNCSIWQTTDSMPVFSFLLYPVTTALKLYIWGRLNWRLPELQNQSFDYEQFQQLYPRVEPLRQQILALYLQIPTTEFWPAYALENFLSQIKGVAHTGGFADRSALKAIFTDLQETLQHLQLMTANGGKSLPGGALQQGVFVLYINELLATNNSLFIRSGEEVQVAILSLDNPNFLQIEDPQVIQHLGAWMQRIQTSAVRISGENENARVAFFRNMHQRLQQVQQELGV